MTRRRYLWSLVLVCILPFVIIGGIWLSIHLTSSGCTGGFECYEAATLFVVYVFVLPIVLLLGMLVIVGLRCQATGMPGLLSVLAGLFATSLTMLLLAPGQFQMPAIQIPGVGQIQIRNAWSVAAEYFSAPFCLIAILAALAILPGPPPGQARGPVIAWIGLWIAAPLVAQSMTLVSLLGPSLFNLRFSMPHWPGLTTAAVAVFVGCLFAIVVVRRRGDAAAAPA